MNPHPGIWDEPATVPGYCYASPNGDNNDGSRPTANYSLLTANSLIFTFSAKERDSETGLSYFGSRYYSSDLSIWLSVDPMSDKYPSLSPYTYCADNPVKLVDPNGKEVEKPDDPPKKNILQKIGDGIAKIDNSLEGHSDGANQANDVPEWVKDGVQAMFVAIPGISEINDGAIVATGKDIYGNEASKMDKNISKASLVTGGALSGTAKGLVTIAKKTSSMATKAKAITAAKVTVATKTVSQAASKIYTSVKLLFNSSNSKENDETKTKQHN